MSEPFYDLDIRYSIKEDDFSEDDFFTQLQETLKYQVLEKRNLTKNKRMILRVSLRDPIFDAKNEKSANVLYGIFIEKLEKLSEEKIKILEIKAAR